jgi:hypothetical protein
LAHYRIEAALGQALQVGGCHEPDGNGGVARLAELKQAREALRPSACDRRPPGAIPGRVFRMYK